MPFINDDAIEVFAVVEGREVFAASGARRERAFCATRSCDASYDPGDEPDDKLCECGESLTYGDTWLCSECGEELFDYGDAKQHLWGHAPSFV